MRYRFVWCGLLAMLLASCAQQFVQQRTSDPPLLGLPLLAAAALVVDGAWRVEVDAGAESPQEVLMLVLRSDADGFRFEAMNELGLPVLAWPARRGFAPAPVDPAIVARLMQLALADADQWSRALQATRWQLVLGANGGRALLRRGASAGDAARTYVTIAVSPAGETLVYCERGMVADAACNGSQWRLQVRPLSRSSNAP